MAENAKTYISNDFLNKYMATAPSAYILVYICRQMFIQKGRTDVSDAELAKSLGMTESDVKNALEYWAEKGEISVRTKAVKQAPSKYIPSAAPSYSQEEISYYINHNEDFRSLLKSAESYMGKLLSVPEISTLYSLHDWLRLPLEVIEILLAYCCENGHRSMRYIETVAISWADDGVTDAASALEHIKDYSSVYMRIMRALGIGGKSPVAKQKEYMKRWSEEFPLDMILYGCEKTALVVTNGNPFPYADKIFSNWKKDGIDTLEKAKKADEKFAESRGFKNRPEQKPQKAVKEKFNYEQRSWDFDELERLKRAELKRNMEE
ncbi:MAG: DnaD domain protein [Clostridia bacterium]|nr:DnaD domain protein [Clostridia bacterium]